MSLTHYPVGVSAQRPACYGAHEGLFIRQALDEIRHQIGKMGYHAIHTTCKYRPIRSTELNQKTLGLLGIDNS